MTPTLPLLRLAAGLALVVAGLASAQAADAPPPAGVLSLSASASTEVTKDVLSLALGASRDGADAAGVQTALKQALDAALAEAKRVARPGQLEVQTGNFSLYPRYSNQGKISGWQGSAELLIEGKDMQAIAQLAGRITTMAITRVGYSLSREQREKVDAEVTGRAIAAFRAKAGEVAQQFGYSGYAIREVSVSGNEATPVYSPMVRAKAMSSASEESLPVEPGKGSVSITVNGSVQMK